MNVGVRANIHAPQLILRGPEIYNRTLISVALRGCELVTIGLVDEIINSTVCQKSAC